MLAAALALLSCLARADIAPPPGSPEDIRRQAEDKKTCGAGETEVVCAFNREGGQEPDCKSFTRNPDYYRLKGPYYRTSFCRIVQEKAPAGPLGRPLRKLSAVLVYEEADYREMTSPHDDKDDPKIDGAAFYKSLFEVARKNFKSVTVLGSDEYEKKKDKLPAFDLLLSLTLDKSNSDPTAVDAGVDLSVTDRAGRSVGHVRALGRGRMRDPESSKELQKAVDAAFTPIPGNLDRALRSSAALRNYAKSVKP